jgi:hypothetical protein
MPAPDAVEHGGEVAFRWAAVQDASGYGLRWPPIPSFLNAPRRAVKMACEAVRTLAVGRWWWRLRSFDARNQPGHGATR